jgi:DNA-directed RNA polymerase subunit omega
LIYPSGDTIEQKVRSRYSRVILAAKRAKQIKEGAPILIDTDSTNPLTIAMEEIAAGKVTVTEAAIVEAAPRDSKKHDDLPGATLARSDSETGRPNGAAAEDTSDQPAA